MSKERGQTREGGRDKGEGKRDFHGLRVGGVSLEARLEGIRIPAIAIHPILNKKSTSVTYWRNGVKFAD